tara:strand:+ start:9619 stop:9852 length:234 start_codon:yes stop_codon:yes gene_type:complete
VVGGIQSWLRVHPYPPLLEHLSVRPGNQLFFVRDDDVDERVRAKRSEGSLTDSLLTKPARTLKVIQAHAIDGIFDGI